MFASVVYFDVICGLHRSVNLFIFEELFFVSLPLGKDEVVGVGYDGLSFL